MGNINKIDNAEILDALKDTTRQYFVGNLSKPQTITFLKMIGWKSGFQAIPNIFPKSLMCITLPLNINI